MCKCFEVWKVATKRKQLLHHLYHAQVPTFSRWSILLRLKPIERFKQKDLSRKTYRY